MATLEEMAGSAPATSGGTSLESMAAGQPPSDPTQISKQGLMEFHKKQKESADRIKAFLDFIQRPGAAREHSLEGPWGPFLKSPLTQALLPAAGFVMDPDTLLHGPKPGQYEADTSAIEDESGLPHGWFSDLLVQSLSDPTNAAGLSGASRVGTETLLKAGTVGPVKTWGAAMRNPALREPATHLGALGAKFHDFFTPGGHMAAHAMRTEALEHGMQGMENYYALYGMRGAAQHFAADLHGVLSANFQRAIHGLSEEERIAVYSAIDRGTIDKLPEKLQNAANDVVRVDQAIPYLGGSAALKKQMSKSGYLLPDDLQRFDTPDARGAISADMVRSNHVPGTHLPIDPNTGEVDLDALLRQEKAEQMGLRGESDLTDIASRQFKTRQGEHVTINATTLPYVEQAWQKSFQRAGQQIAAADLRKTIAQRFAPTKEVRRGLPAAEATIQRAIDSYNASIIQDAYSGGLLRTKYTRPPDLLTRADFDKLSPSVQDVLINPVRQTAVHRLAQRFADAPQHVREFFKKPGERAPQNPWEATEKAAGKYIGGGLREISDLSRSALFTLPFQHPERIASLSMLHAPETIPNALLKFVKTKAGFADEATKAKVLGNAARAGATGVPNIEKSKLTEALHGLSDIIGKAPVVGKAGAATTLAASKWFDGVQKIVWGFDDASKSALFEKYVKRYGDPYVAAYHVQQDMVDYGQSSPFIEAMRTISSFPTWRTKMPIAVLRGLARSPQNAVTIARAAPMLFGLMEGKAGGVQGKESASAIAEGVETFLNPRAAVRGTLSPSAKLLVEAVTKWLASGGDPQNFWLYGQSVPSFVEHEAPFVGQIMSATGHGMFPGSPQSNLLFQLTGHETLEPRAQSSRNRFLNFGQPQP